ncbi:hypothetical protein [Xanthomonas fragariae]|uniref:hypothetical protein n=1 Tax=Xanthomonas fragariae TaxID=48664 RepID=UPI001EE01966|nr:hypothetical protein [Xanthomonas fragariae]
MAQQCVLAGHTDPSSPDQFAARFAGEWDPWRRKPLHYLLQIADIDRPNMANRLAQLFASAAPALRRRSRFVSRSNTRRVP